jgi:hypothetical protein
MLDFGLSDVLIYFILKAELMIVSVKVFALKHAAFAALHKHSLHKMPKSAVVRF